MKIFAAEHRFISTAQILSEQFALIFSAGDTPTDEPFVFVEDSGAQLCLRQGKHIYRLPVGLRERSLLSRVKCAQSEWVVKACGANQPSIHRILDATAGLGHDGLLLAQGKAEVTLIERHPLLHFLLNDSFKEATCTLPTLLQADAKIYLQALTSADYPDVIYIDAMHPPRRKTAAVKADLRLLRSLVGSDLDAEELFEIARARAKQRVVTKLPCYALPYQPKHVSYQLTGRAGCD